MEIREIFSIVEGFFREVFPLNRGDKLILGVSGGPDSVFMLDVLYRVLFKDEGIDLIVAHYNHAQRPDADEDEAFVRDLARESYGLEFVSDRLSSDLPKGLGLEAALRRVRYGFFKDICRSYNARAVSLAHNMDDQAETVLLNLLRGSGMQGLKAMLPKSSRDGITIIRPIMRISRYQIEDYIREKSLPYRIDSSNFSMDFMRNKIRHELLPFLAEHYNPRIKERLFSLANIMAQDYDFIYNVSSQVLKNIVVFAKDGELFLSRTAMESLQESIARQVFRLVVWRLKGDLNRIDFRHYEEFARMMRTWPNGSRLDLPGDVSVEKKARGYRFFLREGKTNERQW